MHAFSGSSVIGSYSGTAGFSRIRMCFSTHDFCVGLGQMGPGLDYDHEGDVDWGLAVSGLFVSNWPGAGSWEI